MPTQNSSGMRGGVIGQEMAVSCADLERELWVRANRSASLCWEFAANGGRGWR